MPNPSESEPNKILGEFTAHEIAALKSLADSLGLDQYLLGSTSGPDHYNTPQYDPELPEGLTMKKQALLIHLRNLYRHDDGERKAILPLARNYVTGEMSAARDVEDSNASEEDALSREETARIVMRRALEKRRQQLANKVIAAVEAMLNIQHSNAVEPTAQESSSLPRAVKDVAEMLLPYYTVVGPTQLRVALVDLFGLEYHMSGTTLQNVMDATVEDIPVRGRAARN